MKSPWKKPKPALREVQLQKLKALLNQIGWTLTVPKGAVEGGEILGAVVGTRNFCGAVCAALEEPSQPEAPKQTASVTTLKGEQS